ncbi:MAG: ADP-dependent NAD(P)H-hydrate dehydratase / NAD(P)H-hydrate epimerase [Patescibacteria group bacterium]|nr:ADP-dependent NAD(P)H-hydrate dehydratase / NAD(P)H-hydrate epimerase [Patescibacteria group bacterium]
MDYPYWHKQTVEKPLYPEVAWSKPEQKSRAGKLGIIGGNKLGFISVAESYGDTLKYGAGEIRVLLPDVLKKSIPTNMTDVIYGASNPSGSLAKDAFTEMLALGEWSTGILMIGDAGRNSETAILYENFISEYQGPLVITRDAIDLIKNSANTIVDRPNTLLVASFAQLQKLFQSVYYPKILTFSMQLTNLVEALHKFTITYPISIVIFHRETLLVASSGEVTSTPWVDQMKIWRGKVASINAVYWIWNPEKVLKSVTASLLET